MLGVCRRVREWAPATRILVTSTTADDDGLLYASLLAGASGAVTRADDGLVDVGALTAVRRGESVLRPGLATRILHDVDTWAGERADPLNPPPTLTETEREVLRRLGSGCSAATIAGDHGVTERLVNLHTAYAVAKLHRHVPRRRDPQRLPGLTGPAPPRPAPRSRRRSMVRIRSPQRRQPWPARS